MAKWIKTYRGKYRDEFHECVNSIWACDCSECGWHTGQQGVNFKFCPNCGSPMENALKDDVVPMENIDKVIAEINNLDLNGCKRKYDDNYYQLVSDILDIINKYCKENTDGSN